jgi:hypothetical protein
MTVAQSRWANREEIGPCIFRNRLNSEAHLRLGSGHSRHKKSRARTTQPTGGPRRTERLDGGEGFTVTARARGRWRADTRYGRRRCTCRAATGLELWVRCNGAIFLGPMPSAPPTTLPLPARPRLRLRPALLQKSPRGSLARRPCSQLARPNRQRNKPRPSSSLSAPSH